MYLRAGKQRCLKAAASLGQKQKHKQKLHAGKPRSHLSILIGMTGLACDIYPS